MKVFICSCFKEAEALTNRIYNYLNSNGIQVYVDAEFFRTGRVDMHIAQRIEECDCFLAILPPGSLDYCMNHDDLMRYEISNALALGKNVIPVMMPGFEYPYNMPDDIVEIRAKRPVIISDNMFNECMGNILRLVSETVALRHRKVKSNHGHLIAAIILTLVMLIGCSAAAYAIIIGNGGNDEYTGEITEDEEADEEEDSDDDKKEPVEPAEEPEIELEEPEEDIVIKPSEDEEEEEEQKEETKEETKKNEKKEVVQEKNISMKKEDKEVFDKYGKLIGMTKEEIDESLHTEFTEEWRGMELAETNLHDVIAYDSNDEDEAVCVLIYKIPAGNVLYSLWGESDYNYDVPVKDVKEYLGEGVIGCELAEKYHSEIDHPYYLYFKRDGYVFRIFYDEDEMINLKDSHCMVSLK